jgi:hypothetical protein
MKKLVLLMIMAFVGSSCFAQQPAIKNKMSLVITARSYSDQIVLRYVPTSPILLSQANKVGYIVERADYIQGISFEKLSFIAIKGSPLVRWDDGKWKTALSKDSTKADLIALAMAYTDSATTGGDVLINGLTSLKEQINNANMRYGFALIASNRSQIAAEGLALRVSDFAVTLGKTYVYRVRINQPVKNPATDMAYVKITCQNFNDQYLKNDTVVKIVEDDGAITFSFPESSEYYAFSAERSDDNGASYKKINNTPVLNFKPTGFQGKSNFAYRDTSLTNYKKYPYRILVSTVFADELVLAEFEAMPRDKTPPPAPFLISAIHVKPGEVELQWEMTGKPVADLKGFMVGRGISENGAYNLISKGILPIASRKFTDTGFDPEGPNYYIVEAVDTAGNSSRSYPAYVTLIDSIPPAEPVISSAKIDSTGKITIKVKPNTEKDFMGYQLLKANAREHEFSVVTETFKDSLGRTTFMMNDSTTLNTLTKNIYYKVIAFDTHFNQSVPSKIIELTKRDTIPPVSPLITGFAVNDTSVVIRSANSSSEDAVRNILLRREKAGDKFDTIFSNSDSRSIRFIDAKIVGGRTYEYAMVAKDDGGLISKISKSIQVRTLLNNRIPKPKLEGNYDLQNKKISLSFVVDDRLKNRKLKVELYKRSEIKFAWINFKTIDYVKGKIFQDDPEKGQKGMIYTIRLTDENQNSSNFSNELELKF